MDRRHLLLGRKVKSKRMNTRISYLYRDGSNYKAGHSVVVEGRLTFQDIKACLDQSTYFIPYEIGWPELQEQLPEFPGEDDHIWHELNPEDFEETDSPAD